MKPLSNWSIDLKSGHCKYPYGVDAYLGKTSTELFIPLVGPYTRCDLSYRELAPIVVSLITEIEGISAQKTVVFGSLSHLAGAKPISVLGIKKKWIPDPSARSSWIINQKKLPRTNTVRLLAREWSRVDELTIEHISGIRIQYSDNCFSSSISSMFRNAKATVSLDVEFDPNLWMSENRDTGIHSIVKAGFKALCILENRTLMPRIIRVEEPWGGAISQAS